MLGLQRYAPVYFRFRKSCLFDKITNNHGQKIDQLIGFGHSIEPEFHSRISDFSLLELTGADGFRPSPEYPGAGLPNDQPGGLGKADAGIQLRKLGI